MERVVLHQLFNMEMIPYLFLLLLSGNCLTTLGKQEVKLGVLLPSRGNFPFVKGKIIPAIEYAIASIEADQKLPSHTLVINYRDSECSETIGPLKAIDLYVDKDVDIFFGPVCDYAVAPIARFSGYWNIPIISAGAPVRAFDNKTEYRLLTRIQGTYAKNAEFVLEVARTFNWSNAGLFFHENMGRRDKGKSNCFFAMQPIFYNIKYHFKIEPKYEQFDENFPEDYDYAKLLRSASTYTRSE